MISISSLMRWWHQDILDGQMTEWVHTLLIWVSLNADSFPNWICVHLVGLNDIPHLARHTTREVTSSCKSAGETFFALSNVSSAYNRQSECLTEDGLSSMYRSKSTGPSTEPWGTSDSSTVNSSDLWPLAATTETRFFSQFSIQSQIRLLNL